MSDIISEINERIEEIENDERLSYDDANVQTNAPLALHQVSQKRALSELRWVKEMIEDE